LAKRAREGLNFVNLTRGYSPGAAVPGDVFRIISPDPPDAADFGGGFFARVEGCDWSEGVADPEPAAACPDGVGTAGAETAGTEAAGTCCDLTAAGVVTAGGGATVFTTVVTTGGFGGGGSGGGATVFTTVVTTGGGGGGGGGTTVVTTVVTTGGFGGGGSGGVGTVGVVTVGTVGTTAAGPAAALPAARAPAASSPVPAITDKTVRRRELGRFIPPCNAAAAELVTHYQPEHACSLGSGSDRAGYARESSKAG